MDGGQEIVCDIRREYLAYPEGVVGWGGVASGTKLFGKEHLPFLDSYLMRVAVPSEFHEKGKEKGKESGRVKEKINEKIQINKPLSGEERGCDVSLSGRMLFSAQFVCLGYGRDDVREDVFFAKFLYKAYFVKVCKDIVVYAAEDDLYAVFL